MKFLNNLCIESDISTKKDKVSQQIRGYIPILEGYRGIACLLVFFVHIYFSQSEQNLSFFAVIYNKILSIGWCGVDAFFVLSGFLITGILLDNKEESHYFKHFYIRRVLRIFPLYYVTLSIFLFLLRPALNQDEGYLYFVSIQNWYWLYLQNWEIALHGREILHFLSHFWSLAVEEQFYLFWPFIVYFIPRHFFGGTIAFLITFSILIRNILLLSHLPNQSLIILYSNTLCRMDSLAVGAAIAFLVRSPYGLPLLIRYSRLLFLLSSCSLTAIFIIRGKFDRLDPLIQSFGYSLLAIFFGSLLIFSLYLSEDCLFVRVLSWSPFRQLGRISYSFYIYHVPILALFRNSLTRYAMDLTRSYWVGEFLVVLFFGIVTFAVASLSWHILEKPILKLKKYFPTRQNPTPLNLNLP
ncbi:MAG: acyltransferase [Cyanobacteria bacterium SBLK]|nr:acyltransferase [Cyanobacteria bacterium SBLK]